VASIDGIKILNDPGLQADKTQALWFIGMGTGGPAVTAGAMLLLYEVALALFIGLAFAGQGQARVHEGVQGIRQGRMHVGDPVLGAVRGGHSRRAGY